MAIKSTIGTNKGTGVYIDYTGLSAAIANTAMRAPEINDKAVKKHAREWVKAVTEGTPVKTGRARAGWYKGVVGLGMSWTDRGTNDKGWMDKGKSEGVFIDRTHNKYKKYVVIENKVPYINALNTGTHYSSPVGMATKATVGMQRKLKKTLTTEYVKTWNKPMLSKGRPRARRRR